MMHDADCDCPDCFFANLEHDFRTGDHPEPAKPKRSGKHTVERGILAMTEAQLDALERRGR